MRRAATITAVAAAVLGAIYPMAGAASAQAATPTIVVAPDGSDSGTGSVADPLRTVQLAVQRLGSDGGVVALRGGVYHQRVRLVGVRNVSLIPYAHEHPVLSGAGLTPPKDLTALVEIADSTDVTVRGLELTGYRTSALNHVPAGVYVHGHDHGVRIVDNHVHDLGNDNNTLGSFDINAHGIAAYGDDPTAPISGLAISGNTVDNLHLGASETVVVNGNVDGWSITNNRIHDNDNIGIDAIGYEPTLTGRYRYTDRNRARHGTIEGNVVSRIRSRGNPAYWEDGEWCNCADGIYVDGGTQIDIVDNQVSDSDIGVEVAAENPRGSADHVRVEANHITGSLFTGITTGGYCNGGADCGGVRTGTSHDNTFNANYLRGNNRLDDGSPELLMQYYTSRDTFTHNTIIATNTDHVLTGTVAGGTGHDNRSDDNHFQVVGGTSASAQFGWSGHTYRGFDTYRAATGQDADSTFTALP